MSFKLSIFYAHCLLCWVSFILSVFYGECLLCWVSFMLSVFYAECLLYLVSPLCPLCGMSLCYVLLSWMSWRPLRNLPRGERKLKTSKGIHRKTFYGRRRFWEVVNGSVCHFQSHPTLSNIWREGWSLQDATLRLHALPKNIRLGWKWLKLTNTWMQQHGKLL